MSAMLNTKIVPLSEVDMNDLELHTPPPRVLVVDDEPLVADTLAAILKRAGLASQAVYSGQAALELVTKDTAALLITDVSMPQMNGVELAIEVVARQPSCKVILFSGHATSADLVAAVSAGHNFPLLNKPMHPTEMLRYVAETLGLPHLGPTPAKSVDTLPFRATPQYA